MNEIVLKDNIKVENLIYEVRGVQVMLDSDLARLYGCLNGTKTINQAVNRNKEKFPSDFYFRLTNEEYREILRSQFGTLELKQGKYSKYLPYVFTEQGVAMLATVLRTKVAAEVSVSIMRAFVLMRKYLSNTNYEKRLSNMETKLIDHDSKIDKLFSIFDDKKNNYIFFDKQFYDAYSKIVDIMSEAKKELIIIDSYADKSVLDMIKNVKAKVILIVKNKSLLKENDILNYKKQYNNLKIIYSDIFHDRYFILDKEKIYHCGASINYAGSKTFSINLLLDEVVKKSLIDKVSSLKDEKNTQ